MWWPVRRRCWCTTTTSQVYRARMSQNLRGIPKAAIDNRLHLSVIRNMWNDFYAANPAPARRAVPGYAARSMIILVSGYTEVALSEGFLSNFYLVKPEVAGGLGPETI